ncbi:oxygen-independent coproporphyrinogen III oxidase [Dinoroseobacter sp. S76]|uniref:oxygen-independent coproporphyrinogen III oxidase n=1 Tax=Dinoroseobacter sp. S76 TaxID=3415124 RepID=UPI003C7E0D3B
MDTKTQLSRLGLFDARVPRYTSYPTATHFAKTVSAAHFTDWVSAITPGTEISLYAHVPFCRRLCWFCACRTQGTQSDEPVRAYVETLLTEIAMLREALPEGVRLSRIHWGGGTPTLLGPDMMRELAAAMFAVAPKAENAEFSVEIDPNEIDDARLDALAAAGMNRASIGVQDFDPEIQKAIGREQSFEVTEAAVLGLRARGIQSLNTDILYGLPFQTGAKITDSVQKLLSLQPDRVALYGYAHVPWMARRQNLIPNEALPTPEARLELFDTARRLFRWDNYAEIGIDHFAHASDGLALAAQTGKLRRNFQGYTDDTASVLIGLGASAISRFPQGYAQNASGTAQYQKAIRARQFATARGHAFVGDDLLRARMIEMVMCDFKIDGSALQQEFPITEARLWEMLQRAADQFEGMVIVDRERLTLTIPERAQPLTRMIARAFDGYEAPAGSHSIAT